MTPKKSGLAEAVPAKGSASGRAAKSTARHRKPAKPESETTQPAEVVVVESMIVETMVENPVNTPAEDIARLAYALWEARGCPQGSAEEDWLTAEKELMSKAASASA